MKKLILIVLVGGAAVFLLGVQGVINVPGITPAPTPKSGVENLTPPPADKDVGGAPPAPPLAKKSESKPEVRKLEPSTPSSRPKSLFPPIKPEDVARARGFYEKGDFSNVQRSLEGCERAEESASTQAARTLFRKSRLLAALTREIARSPLANASSLERVSLDSGGTVVGNVLDRGENLVIQLPGSVETTVTKDQVVERAKVGREVLDEKLRTRLKDRAAKVDADDAIGNYRLGHYCWQYGLETDAMPYLDRAVEGDDFPVIAKVFGGSQSDQLVDGWCELTGKPRPSEQVAKKPTAPTPPPAAGKPPAPAPQENDGFALARKRYEEGVARYKVSFGDSAQATKALKDARALFLQARDLLQRIGNGEDPNVEQLQTQVARLLYDCNKRSSIQ